ncbi:MAG: ResB protein required for cytochrome C biosynthesis, partial [Opitutus sp.]
MTPLVRQFRDFFVSLKLTVVLLALSIVLIFWATLAQVHLGIWGVQQKFFHAFFVLEKIPGTEIPVPVFPGGYFIGGLLLINLVAAHVYRFKFEWRKLGIQLTHAGLIRLLVGELISGLLQVESQMRLEEGAPGSHYSESYRLNELAVLDTTNPDYDEVVAIPEDLLADGGVIQHPKLPFQLRIRDYYPNAIVQMRDQVPNAAPALATAGIGSRLAVTPIPLTYKQDERNAPASDIEVITPEGTQGSFLL